MVIALYSDKYDLKKISGQIFGAQNITSTDTVNQSIVEGPIIYERQECVHYWAGAKIRMLKLGGRRNVSLKSSKLSD